MLGKPKNALFTLAVARRMISTMIGGRLMWGIRVLVPWNLQQCKDSLQGCCLKLCMLERDIKDLAKACKLCQHLQWHHFSHVFG